MNANDIAGNIISTGEATRTQDHYHNQIVDFADGRRVVISDEHEDGEFIGLTWSWYLTDGSLDHTEGLTVEDIPTQNAEAWVTDKVLGL